jgi:hypothetical protein
MCSPAGPSLFGYKEDSAFRLLGKRNRSWSGSKERLLL